MDALPIPLVDLLSVSTVLRQTAPYLSIGSLLSLSATNKTLRDLVYSSPEPWRHLDLTRTKSAIIDTSPIDVGGVSWRAERMDESLTEDDFYAGPLRGIFGKLQRKRVLKNVHTLILDGLSVPADLVREIVSEDRFNVKILSIRNAKNLNQAKLRQVLRYVTRPTRIEGTPKLRGLYFFSAKDPPSATRCEHAASGESLAGVMASEGAQLGFSSGDRDSKAQSCKCQDDDDTKWYQKSGKALKRPLTDWPETIQLCQGVVSFDAVLCRGPRHDITKVDSKDFLQPAVANVALGPEGCEACGSCPEGPAVFGESPEYELPLLSPPPLHSSTVHAAQYPQPKPGSLKKLILRCEQCLRNRWCELCNRWWCEDCYEEPTTRAQLRTELQQAELREDLGRDGWSTVERQGLAGASGPAVKVYSNFCVEHCLVGEMMSGAGSNGMWG